MSAIVTVEDVPKEEEVPSSFADMIKNERLFTSIFEEIEETATRLAYIERKKHERFYPSMIQIVDEYCRVKGEGSSFKKGVAFGLLMVLQQKEAEGSEFREFLAAKKRQAAEFTKREGKSESDLRTEAAIRDFEMKRDSRRALRREKHE